MVRYVDLVSDTICSLITAPGHAGVAVIRISGNQALNLIKQISTLKDIDSHCCRLVEINDEKGLKVDQAVVTYFAKGKSFTGDETIEIACHGNPLIVNQIINNLLSLGCRSAERGEFTFRSFFNGNIDLVQAESIQSLVMSDNQFGSSQFLDQLSGSLSNKLDFLEKELITVLGHIEANIDFVEEDITPDDLQSLLKKLGEMEQTLQDLLRSYDVGKNLSDSFKILILGKTNVGKSSLFNRIIDKERSIITDIEGTTRDLISEKVFIDNYSVEFLDSAGLRNSSDVVENIGITRALDYQKSANLILFVFDGGEIPTQLPIELNSSMTILVVNKMDTLNNHEKEEVHRKINNINNLNMDTQDTQYVSAKTGEGVNELKERIKEQIISVNSSDQKNVLTQARHFDHLSKLQSCLQSSKHLIETGESPDLISQELQLGLSELHELLGKEYNDEILDKIFSDFCIGK